MIQINLLSSLFTNTIFLSIQLRYCHTLEVSQVLTFTVYYSFKSYTISIFICPLDLQQSFFHQKKAITFDDNYEQIWAPQCLGVNLPLIHSWPDPHAVRCWYCGDFLCMPAEPDKLALGNSSKRCGKTREERAGGSERTQHTGSAYASHSQTIGTRIDFFSAKAPPRAAPIAIMCSRLKTIYYHRTGCGSLSLKKMWSLEFFKIWQGDLGNSSYIRHEWISILL